jgi:hypothetical protein
MFPGYEHSEARSARLTSFQVKGKAIEAAPRPLAQQALEVGFSRQPASSAKP